MMQCPRCGATMNHHADKVVDPVTREEREQVDEAFGGVVKQAHLCAGCGHAEFRVAPSMANDPRDNERGGDRQRPDHVGAQ